MTILTLRPIARAMPRDIVVFDEGIAVANYEDGAVQYSSLKELMDDHGLRENDFESRSVRGGR